jgi:cytidylate kinase
VKKNILERDQIDYTGDTPTSEKASDAIVLDTTTLTIDEQIASVVAWARKTI